MKTGIKLACRNLKNYDRICKAVFEDGEASKGSFYIVGSGAALTFIEEHSFTVTSHRGTGRLLLREKSA